MQSLGTLIVSMILGSAAAIAGDVQPLMVQRGALLLDESFDGSLDTTKWNVAIGQWKVDNGVLAGTERPADHHPAVIKTPFSKLAAVVQFSFMLKGQSSIHFSINDPSGHNCRIVGLSTTDMASSNTNGPLKLLP